jgi:hypothetical protein
MAAVQDRLVDCLRPFSRIPQEVIDSAGGQPGRVGGMKEIDALAWRALKRKLERGGTAHAV